MIRIVGVRGFTYLSTTVQKARRDAVTSVECGENRWLWKDWKRMSFCWWKLAALRYAIWYDRKRPGGMRDGTGVGLFEHLFTLRSGLLPRPCTLQRPLDRNCVAVECMLRGVIKEHVIKITKCFQGKQEKSLPTLNKPAGFRDSPG